MRSLCRTRGAVVLLIGWVSLYAARCGEATLEVDGAVVLRGRGESETAHVGPGEPLNRPAGVYRLRLRYRSLASLPARLQVWWQGPTFAREPLPAWHLGHLAAEL